MKSFTVTLRCDHCGSESNLAYQIGSLKLLCERCFDEEWAIAHRRAGKPNTTALAHYEAMKDREAQKQKK